GVALLDPALFAISSDQERADASKNAQRDYDYNGYLRSSTTLHQVILLCSASYAVLVGFFDDSLRSSVVHAVCDHGWHEEGRSQPREKRRPSKPPKIAYMANCARIRIRRVSGRTLPRLPHIRAFGQQNWEVLAQAAPTDVLKKARHGRNVYSSKTARLPEAYPSRWGNPHWAEARVRRDAYPAFSSAGHLRGPYPGQR